jgi:serine/threonine protein kinase
MSDSSEPVESLYGDTSLFSKPRSIIKTVGAGSFGKVHIAQVDGVQYYVKQSTLPGKFYKLVKQEIETNMHVTASIPQYVSRLFAAKLVGSPTSERIASEQWFEYLPGMDMIDAINTADYRNPKYKQYVSSLYCMANEALRALHRIGYIHRDIKPDNLFVVQETPYTPVAVKLIDFGTAYNMAEDKPASLFGTTTGYSPYFFPGESPITHPRKRAYPGKPSTSNNFYAMDVMWESLFGRIAPPVCSPAIPIMRQQSYYSNSDEPMAGGKSRRRRASRRRTRKN